MTATMGRIRIKHPRPKDAGVRRQLLDILSTTLRVSRLIPANDAIVILTPTDKDADAVFLNDTPNRLASAGFTPIVPPELRAQRTVICHGLDELVYEHSPEEIAVEVEQKHDWAKAEDVFKFPRSSTCKITFTDSNMAKKALLEGLNLFQIHVSGHQMRQEMFIPLLTCNRCNVVEDHPTNSCPRPAGYMRCSECGSEEHTFRSCPAPSKTCFNCGGDHSARAMRCPIRKEALKKKEEAIRKAHVRPGVSYAQTTTQQAPAPTGLASPDPTKSLAGLLCLWHAHLTNSTNPGCFQQVLSKGLADNGLPDIKLPPPLPLRPSESVVRALAEGAAQAIATGGPAPVSSAIAEEEEPSSPPSSAPSPSAEDTEDTEDEEDEEEASQDPPAQEVGYAFVGRSSKRKRIPSSYNDLVHCLNQKTLIFIQSGPARLKPKIMNHVKENIGSLHHWIINMTEVYERAKTDPQPVLLDALPGRYTLARE